MRNLLIALALVALVVAPSFGSVLTVKFVPEVTAGTPGQVVPVKVQVMGVPTAVSSIAGDITATADSGAVSSNFAFATGIWEGTVMPAGVNRIPTAVVGGGWDNLAAQQNTVSADSVSPIYGNGVLVDFASFNVTLGNKDVTFGFAPDQDFTFSDLYCSLVGDDTMAISVVPATITVPEPMTMALLALGGLFVARRRSH